jgi:mRNA interferase MazF
LLNRVQVAPVSSQTNQLYPVEAAITLKGRRRKAMADQIATVSKRRLPRRPGVLTANDLESVNRVIRIQLGL